jgi:8-oxo-dGTP pyrophosphatase MutT (NUDIX family)
MFVKIFQKVSFADFMIKQFTATVYLIKEKKVLLIFHPKFHKWLPPGGHIEPNESPTEAARREVLEETGFTIEFIKQENLWIEYENAASFERPYLCFTEEIPAYKETPAHQHIDFIYLARPIAQIQEPEDSPCKWFGMEELQELKSDVIFKDTLEVIHHLLSPSFSLTPQPVLFP